MAIKKQVKKDEKKPVSKKMGCGTGDKKKPMKKK